MIHEPIQEAIGSKVTLAGSDNAVRPDLAQVLPVMGFEPSAATGGSAPAIAPKTGIADLVTSNRPGLNI